MKIEINKHYSVLNNGEIICPKDYPKDTQADAENFAQCIQNQVLDVYTNDGLLVHFIKNKDCQSDEIVNAVKSIFDDNGFTVFDVLNLVYPFPCPQKMVKVGNMSSTKSPRLYADDKGGIKMIDGREIFKLECDDKTKRKNDILYQEYLNNNISTDDFKKSVYNNIWSKYLHLHPILKEDMWKKEMLRLIGDEVSENE